MNDYFLVKVTIGTNKTVMQVVAKDVDSVFYYILRWHAAIPNALPINKLSIDRMPAPFPIQ